MALAEPQHLAPGQFQPRLSEESSILTADQVTALASAVPARYRLSDWTLQYSMGRHGISLQTMYRRGAGSAPTILVVRDTMGYVFGCYTSESWRVAPRYYGTGETFVFQLQVCILLAASAVVNGDAPQTPEQHYPLHPPWQYCS